MLDIIIDKYCEIFRDCFEEEFVIIEVKVIFVIMEIILVWIIWMLMFVFGDVVELFKIVEFVFMYLDVCNFVYGLIMWFIICIFGNEDISFEKLVDILMFWCFSSDLFVCVVKYFDVRLEFEVIIFEFLLIFKEILMLIRNVLLGINMNIGVILEFNWFLIVFMMFNIGGFVLIFVLIVIGKVG